MSIMRRVVERIAQVLPDRQQDELQSERRYLSQPVDRIDGIDKVTGEARFSAEYPVDGLVHGAIAFSTIRERESSRASKPVLPNRRQASSRSLPISTRRR